jgi:predicted outer membrane lipoprotein
MTFHDDIAARLDDLRQREAAHRENSLRRIDAINKAITLILTVAAFGVLTALAFAPTEQSLKASALSNQEQITWQK